MFELTLSFDGGPTPGVMPFVLDVLGRDPIAATFFVVGEKAAAPDALDLCARARVTRATGSATTPGAVRRRSACATRSMSPTGKSTARST